MKAPHNFKEIKHPRPTAPFNKVSHAHPGGSHPLHKPLVKKFLKLKPRKRKI